MKHLKYLLIFSLIIFSITSCKKDELILPAADLLEQPVDPKQRGTILSSNLIGEFTTGELRDFLEGYDPAINLIFNPQAGVTVHKVLYETIDFNGEPLIGSGVVAYPTNPEEALPFSTYMHGTSVLKTGVPSNESDEYIIGLVMASLGYISCLPDFIGMGESPGMHLYVHKKTQATCGVDIMRAARRLVDSKGIAENGDAYVFGYSQGGHAALGLHEELETLHSDEFLVRASAPMSGPHDLSGVMVDVMLSDEPYARPFYLPYLLLSYNEAYDLYDNYSDFMVEPYATELPPLFNGLYSAGEIDQFMPASGIVKEIIKPDVIASFMADENYPFRQKLKENNTHNFVPLAPVRMLYCTGDEQVDYNNSLVAETKLLENGAENVVAIELGSGDHADCVLPCLIWAKNYFNFLKDQ